MKLISLIFFMVAVIIGNTMSAKIVKRQQLFFSPPQQDSSGFPNQFFNRYPQFDQQQNNFQGNQVFNQNQRPAFGNQQIPNQNNNNNRQVSTTAVPRTTLQPTTLSPAVQQCTDGCVTQTTSEYNPVCGSDNQNYHNPARLECAQQCGVRVTRLRAGTCGQAGRSK